MTRWGLKALIAITFCGIASPAFALDTGQCLPMAAMNAALKSEGQRTLIIGDRLDYDGQIITFADTTMTRAEWRDLARNLASDTQARRDMVANLRAKGRTQAHIDAFIAKLRGVTAILENGDPDAPVPKVMNAFVSNADGSVAYDLEGDKPSGENSTRACIRAKLGNVGLAKRSLVNAGASVKGELFAGSGNVLQLNGTLLTGANVSLRGSFATGDATFVAVLPGNKTPPLFFMAGARLTPVALSRIQD